MRCLLLTALVVLCACGTDSQPEQENICELGLAIHGEALKAALDKAPDCRVDTDCVVMQEQIACPGSIEIALCDLAVHESVLVNYDRKAVAQALCEATEGQELGCSINAACRDHGEPECSAGECTFAD